MADVYEPDYNSRQAHLRRRLRLKGLIEQVPDTHAYRVTRSGTSHRHLLHAPRNPRRRARAHRPSRDTQARPGRFFPARGSPGAPMTAGWAGSSRTLPPRLTRGRWRRPLHALRADNLCLVIPPVPSRARCRTPVLFAPARLLPSAPTVVVELAANLLMRAGLSDQAQGSGNDRQLRPAPPRGQRRAREFLASIQRAAHELLQATESINRPVTLCCDSSAVAVRRWRRPSPEVTRRGVSPASQAQTRWGSSRRPQR